MPDWFKLSTNLLAWVVFPHLSTPSKRINAPRDKDFAAIFASSSSEYLSSAPPLFARGRRCFLLPECPPVVFLLRDFEEDDAPPPPPPPPHPLGRIKNAEEKTVVVVVVVVVIARSRCASRSPFRALPFLFSLEQRSLVKSKGHSTISFSLLFSLFFLNF